jgi:hypothetical protein
MQDSRSSFSGELARFLRGLGWRALPTHILLVIAFGIFLPWMRGLNFMDPVLLAAYACLGVLFAAPAAAQSFAERPASMPHVYARIAIAVLYGELMTIAMLAAAFATFYFLHPLPIGPDVPGLARINAFGLCASLAMAAGSAWITLRFSASAARVLMRLAFLALLIVFFFKSRWLPELDLTAALAALLVGAIAILAIRRDLLRHAQAV